MMFEKNKVYDRAALLKAFGLKPVELPEGWELSPNDTATPPSRKVAREYRRATGNDLGGVR
jgi:hypothetical protein